MRFAIALLLLSSSIAAVDSLGDPAFCNSLTSTSLQMKGQKLAAISVSTREGCCAACQKQPGCQMWWLKDDAAKGFACELYGLDNGPVTWSIMYKTHAGVMTSGPSALVERSSECNGDVWLFKDVALDGVVKASAADPYLAPGTAFANGFKTSTWQECCKGALQAPGTTLMERGYQYRGRQYWVWNASQGTCYVSVRPFQGGATVLTMRRAPGVISGMFGNEP